MTSTPRLPLALALASAALLAACGGGSGDDDAPPPATAAEIRSFNDLSAYCGAGVTLPDDDADDSLQQLIYRSVTIDRITYDVSITYAAKGWVPIDESPVAMSLPMNDMRSIGKLLVATVPAAALSLAVAAPTAAESLPAPQAHSLKVPRMAATTLPAQVIPMPRQPDSNVSFTESSQAETAADITARQLMRAVRMRAYVVSLKCQLGVLKVLKKCLLAWWV